MNRAHIVGCPLLRGTGRDCKCPTYKEDPEEKKRHIQELEGALARGRAAELDAHAKTCISVRLVRDQIMALNRDMPGQQTWWHIAVVAAVGALVGWAVSTMF